jgi:hypothetical protein
MEDGRGSRLKEVNSLSKVGNFESFFRLPPVSLSIFQEFLSALEVNVINITATTFTQLLQLCEEFDFSDIAPKLSEFRISMDFQDAATETEDSNAGGRIAVVEEKGSQHSHVIAILQDKIIQLSTDFGHFVGEVSALPSASAGTKTLSEEISALKIQSGPKQSDSVVE